MAYRATVGREPVKCRGCNREIIFIKTNGKSVPCDPEPVYVRLDPHGSTYITKDGRTIVGQIAGDADDDPDSNLLEAHVSHFATCPNADFFRKRRKSDRRRGEPRPGGSRYNAY